MSIKRITLLLCAIILAGIVSVALWGEASVAKYLDQRAEEVLQAQVSFKDIEIFPLQRKLILRHVKVYRPDRKQEMLSEVKKISIQLESMQKLLSKQKSIYLEFDHPKIYLSTNAQGEWDLAKRVPLLRRGVGEKRLDPWDIERIVLKDGEIEFRDGRAGTVLQLRNVQFKAKQWQLPTAKKPLPVKFEGSFELQGGGKFSVKGEGDFLSPKTSLSSNLQVERLNLPMLAPYYESLLPVHVVNGLASFSAEAQCRDDLLHIPIHTEVEEMKVELKENRSLNFATGQVLDSLRNEAGNVVLDAQLVGDFRRFQFVILTDLSNPAGTVIKQTGKEIKEGVKSGWKKFKGLF